MPTYDEMERKPLASPERSEAMIGSILNTQASRNYRELKMLVAKFPILDGQVVRWIEYAELLPVHNAFWTDQSQYLDFET